MNTPQLSGITDLVSLQNLIVMVLLSDDRLANVPVLPEFKLHTESDLSVDALWTLPRSAFVVTPNGVTVNQQINASGPGPVGVGLLVEMIEGSVKYPDMPGPALNWEIGVVAIEERNTNLTPGVGIGITAEQAVQIVLDIFHILLVKDYGTIRSADKPMAPAHDWMSVFEARAGGPAINCQRASLVSLNSRNQTQRSPNVIIAIAGGTCTLTTPSGSPDAIYYTQTPLPMGSTVPVSNPPAPVKANTAAVIYTGPFPVVSGDVISAASYTAGTIQSAINSAVVT